MDFIFDELKQYMINGENCKELIIGKKYLIVRYNCTHEILYSIMYAGELLYIDKSSYVYKLLFSGIGNKHELKEHKCQILNIKFYELENSFDENRINEIVNFLTQNYIFEQDVYFDIKYGSIQFSYPIKKLKQTFNI